MRRRSRPEPLKPTPQPTWRVVRNRLSQVVESTPLEPVADLGAVLTAAREPRIAEAWECEDIGLCGVLLLQSGRRAAAGEYRGAAAGREAIMTEAGQG